MGSLLSIVEGIFAIVFVGSCAVIILQSSPLLGSIAMVGNSNYHLLILNDLMVHRQAPT